MNELPDSGTGELRVRNLDYLLFTSFACFWLLPILYCGLTEREVPGMPPAATYLYRLGCLFPKSTTHFDAFYIQIMPEPGGIWETVPTETFSRMELFGRVNRVDLILEDSRYVDYEKMAPPRGRNSLHGASDNTGDKIPRMENH